MTKAGQRLIAAAKEANAIAEGSDMKIPHRFTGETIYEAEAETMRDLVVAAVKNGVPLQGIHLREADLRGVNLTHTCILDIGQRSDGYQFYLHCGLDEPHILAGCRYFTVAEARKHWLKTRGGTPLGEESLRMVSDGVARAKIRGLI